MASYGLDHTRKINEDQRSVSSKARVKQTDGRRKQSHYLPANTSRTTLVWITESVTLYNDGNMDVDWLASRP